MTCVGQVIGVVVADDQDIAKRAAKLVKVDYDELPAIITIEVLIMPIGSDNWVVIITLYLVPVHRVGDTFWSPTELTRHDDLTVVGLELLFSATWFNWTRSLPNNDLNCLESLHCVFPNDSPPAFTYFTLSNRYINPTVYQTISLSQMAIISCAIHASLPHRRHIHPCLKARLHVKA